MSLNPEEIDPGETTISVSKELRDKLRREKAKEGVFYDTYLREKLDLDLEE